MGRETVTGKSTCKGAVSKNRSSNKSVSQKSVGQKSVSHISHVGKGQDETRKLLSLKRRLPRMTSEIMLRKQFNAIDKDKNGTISLNELKTMMKTLGQNVSDDQLREVMNRFDRDGDGSISFHEFRDIIRAFMPKPNDRKYLLGSFNDIDIDGDGEITFVDLRSYMWKLGDDPGDDEIKAMINDVSSAKDGRVSQADFLKFMNASN